jgi:hypothetical protein
MRTAYVQQSHEMRKEGGSDEHAAAVHYSDLCGTVDG